MQPRPWAGPLAWGPEGAPRGITEAEVSPGMWGYGDPDSWGSQPGTRLGTRSETGTWVSPGLKV